MRFLPIFLLFFISVPFISTTVIAQKTNLLESMTFQDLRLRQEPSKDMNCIKGACIPGSKNIFSIFKRDKDISSLGEVQISTPQYYFFNNQLTQISFRVLETQEEDKAFAELSTLYGLKLVDEFDLVQSDKVADLAKQYIGDSGMIVELIKKKINGEWNNLYVKIYDKNLMDLVRIKINPNYVPMAIR